MNNVNSKVSFTIEQLQALGVNIGPLQASQTPKKRTIVTSAPKIRMDVSGMIRVEMAKDKEGNDCLAVRTPGFNWKFQKTFCYHSVEKALGYKWPNRKINGEWVKFVPLGDQMLLLEGLKQSYPAGTKVVLNDEVIEL